MLKSRAVLICQAVIKSVVGHGVEDEDLCLQTQVVGRR